MSDKEKEDFTVTIYVDTSRLDQALARVRQILIDQLQAGASVDDALAAVKTEAPIGDNLITILKAEIKRGLRVRTE